MTEESKKRVLYCVIAILIAFLAYSVAQSAQDTADINNVFNVVVNNTDLGCYGGQGGTCERVNGTTYTASDYPILVYIKYHVVTNNAHTIFRFYINGTQVLWRDFTTVQADQNDSFTVVVPKFSNYSYFNSTNVHHVEFREYPVLSGKNGTLSLNQTFITSGTSFNATYAANISALQANDSYFNNTILPSPYGYLIFTDGTTTYAKNGTTGQNDSQNTKSDIPIQFAIDRSQDVFIKQGSYNITTTLQGRSNTRIHGSGIGSTVLFTVLNHNIINYTGTDNFTVSDVSFHGSNTTTATNSGQNGIYIENLSSFYKINNIDLRNFNGYGLYINNFVNNADFTNGGEISGLSAYFNYDGIHLENHSEYNTFSNIITMYNNNNGIYVATGNNKFSSVASVENGYGINISNGFNPAHGEFVACNANHNTIQDIMIKDVGNLGEVFSGCEVFGNITVNGTTGVVFSSSTLSANIALINSSGATFTGNWLRVENITTDAKSYYTAVNNLNTTGNGLSSNNTGLNDKNLLSSIIPTFSGWNVNPGANKDLTNELVTPLTTSGTLNGGATGTVTYDLGSSRRISALLYTVSSVSINYVAIQLSDDNSNFYQSAATNTTAQIFGTTSTTGKARYIKFVLANNGAAASVGTLTMRVYVI